MAESDFDERYAPWALIAGASTGLGAAFANEVASRGVNVVLLARRTELPGRRGRRKARRNPGSSCSGAGDG